MSDKIPFGDINLANFTGFAIVILDVTIGIDSYARIAKLDSIISANHSKNTSQNTNQ